MKKSRFTDSQIIAVLKQAEAGTPVPELCREHGISSATFYNWRSRYGGMDASMISRNEKMGQKMGSDTILRLHFQPIKVPVHEVPWPVFPAM